MITQTDRSGVRLLRLELPFGSKKNETRYVRGGFRPRSPQVDLFPPNVRLVFEVRVIKRLIAAAAVLLAIGAGFVWWTETANIRAAQAVVDTSNQARDAAQAQVRMLLPVESLYTEITKMNDAVNSVLAGDVNSTLVLREFTQLANAHHIQMRSAAFKYTGRVEQSLAGQSSLSGCPLVDPFTPIEAVGCVSFTAFAGSRADVSTFIAAANASGVFTNVYLSGTTADAEGKVSFSGSMSILPAALIREPAPVTEPTPGASPTTISGASQASVTDGQEG